MNFACFFSACELKVFKKKKKGRGSFLIVFLYVYILLVTGTCCARSVCIKHGQQNVRYSKIFGLAYCPSIMIHA